MFVCFFGAALQGKVFWFCIITVKGNHHKRQVGADVNFLQKVTKIFFKVALICALLVFLTRYLHVFVINVTYSSILVLAFEVLVLIFFFACFLIAGTL